MGLGAVNGALNRVTCSHPNTHLTIEAIVHAVAVSTAALAVRLACSAVHAGGGCTSSVVNGEVAVPHDVSSISRGTQTVTVGQLVAVDRARDFVASAESTLHPRELATLEARLACAIGVANRVVRALKSEARSIP